ncbi:MAG: carbon-nitrogen hydrolase family protein [Planctomycetota bacterium]
MRVAIGQISPVLLDRDATLGCVTEAIAEAADRGAKLIAFGEALVPGYPVWLSRTGGAAFDSDVQKDIHAAYLESGVDIDAGHLGAVTSVARDREIAVVVGVAERARDRGGHSLFCSAVTISPAGEIASVHRKLVPTYEERLCWSHGDGAGLVSHGFLEPFVVGALNCWENWMPLARAAMQAQGVNLHVAIWPGSDANTRDITRFVARESRSFVVSASGTMLAEDIPPGFPHRDRLLATLSDDGAIHNGGSAIAGPDGAWVVEPVVGTRGVVVADLDEQRIFRERQNFDPSGHYARPEVLRLMLDRTRQLPITMTDSGPST